MSNRFIRKEEECPLIGKYCNELQLNCNKCIAEEEGWVSLQNGMKFRKVMQNELPTPRQAKREAIISTLKDILGEQYSK